MATLAISKDMLTQYAELPKAAQAKVAQLADRFRQLSAAELRAASGIHLERYNAQKDERARTIRIDSNHRGVVFDAGNDELFVLTQIGTHNDIDRWMANNTFRVNHRTGALEIINTVAISEAVATIEPAAPAEPLLYEHRSDKDFTQLGIDEDHLGVLRLVTNEDQLLGLLGVLPQTQADTLILLLGHETVESIYTQVAGATDPEDVDPDDLSAALRTPASQAQFAILASEAELQEMLAKPLSQWRTYLHPSQRDAAFRDYSGPARVTGGPGTGKTIVAIHRAAHLAANTTQDGNSRPILLTTFTRNLAQTIEHDLVELAGRNVLDSVEVINVDRLAYRVVQDAESARPAIVQGRDLIALWRDVVDEQGSDLNPEFLNYEWEQVVLAQGIDSRDQYLTASRVGRGVSLGRRQRMAVWQLVEALGRKLVDANKRTYLQLAEAAAGHLQQRSLKPFQHVIVDEAQDLHEAQWRLLRAAVPEQPNDLFIVGDSHQRIYDRRSSLRQVGINIVGRSRKLKINYRTTHEILGWSLSVLGQANFDDLDEGTDNNDFAGYHSFLHGPRPVTYEATTGAQQLKELVSQIRVWVDGGISEEDIGVTARASTRFEEIERALRDAGIASCRLGREIPTGIGVRVGTMHRLKGLEFRCVAVADCDDDHMPAASDITSKSADPVQHEADLLRERCLLYVACTRAREALWLGWTGNASPFLPK